MHRRDTAELGTYAFPPSGQYFYILLLTAYHSYASSSHHHNKCLRSPEPTHAIAFRSEREELRVLVGEGDEVVAARLPTPALASTFVELRALWLCKSVCRSVSDGRLFCFQAEGHSCGRRSVGGGETGREALPCALGSTVSGRVRIRRIVRTWFRRLRELIDSCRNRPSHK